MTDVQARTAALLEDKPDLEDGLKELLDVDASTKTWTFEDVPFDSGTFGELVSEGVVEKRDGEYALADRAAVGRAVGVEDTIDGTDTKGKASVSTVGERVSMPAIDLDRVGAIGLAGALALVVLFRVLPWPAVFRGGDVVLSGNDPYAYRYLVHQLLEAGAGPLDLSVLSSLPSGVSHGEPLTVVTLWVVSGLLGGASAVGGVLAWYPVVSALVTALLVYVLAVRVTDDRRVALAAVALLAIMPGHAFRTGLGFADHHAFDYPWLALTALAVVSVVGRGEVDRLGWRTWAWSLTLGIGVAGQTLAWDAGPLLLVPLGLFAVGAVPSWVRSGRSPAREGMALVAGLTVGALIVGVVHLQLGWHSTVVAVAPLLLLGGTIALLGLGELARRLELSVRSLVGLEVSGAIIGIAVLWGVFPAFVDELGRGVDFLISTGGIAETTSIVSGDLGTIVGPVLLFGFALFLAIPYMAWGTWSAYRGHEPAWLVTSLYAWWFLMLSVIQLRFAGQLAIFTALFGGLGFVHVAAWVDLSSLPQPFEGESEARGLREDTDDGRGDIEWPERRRALSLLGLGLGVGSIGMLNTPVKHSQLLVDESIYEAAQFMKEYADERGWEYPENYVFSSWSQNRVYNWFVSGESRSYGYAQSNFGEFVTSRDGEEWYEQLRDRVGFVAVEADDVSSGVQTQAIYDQLWSDGLGIETEHYRAVWTDPDDSLRVFTLVPGARVTGPAPANTTARIDVSAKVGDESRSIEMETNVGEHGVYQETVPLPGTYETGGASVTVSEADVLEGALVSGFDGEGYAQWTFDEGSGEWAYDRVGGHHGQIHAAEWTTKGRSESALSFGGKDSSDYVEAPMETLQEFTISLWAYPTALDVTEGNDWREIVRTGGGSILIFEQNGNISFRLPGVGGDRVIGSGIRTDRWQHVAITFDGSERTVYLNGEQRASDEVSVSDLDWGGQIRFGNQFETPSGHGYAGMLDNIRIHNRVLSSEEIGNAIR